MNKIEYLKQCIRLTEDLLSSGDDLEKIQTLIQQRGDVLLLIAELEKTPGEGVSASETATADQLIELLTKLNDQAVKKIKKEQQDILAAMKVNIKEHKLVGYHLNDASSAGRLLDKKR